MNREDIIRKAREAGSSVDDPADLLTLANLERFVALVIAAEQERCAKVSDSLTKKRLTLQEKQARQGMFFVLDWTACGQAVRGKSTYET